MTFLLTASPVLWVTLTTVVGFAALLSSEITPIRSFAWMMSIGTSLLLLTFPMLLPAGVLAGKAENPPGLSEFERNVTRVLDRMTEVTTAWPEPLSASPPA